MTGKKIVKKKELKFFDTKNTFILLNFEKEVD